jgi:hypothetical protein
VRPELALLSEIVDRLAFAQTHGLQYGGDRDIYRVAGYPKDLRWNNYAGMYERDPVAGRVVDMIAETTWRKPPLISEPDKEDGTEFTEAWEAMAKRLGIWQKFEAADKLARIGQYSVILLGYQGGDDRALPMPPLRMSDPEDLLYVSLYSERLAQIDRWVTDPASERYGQPETYKIDLAGNVPTFRSTSRTGTAQVHATRVIHVAEDPLDDPVFGKPALRRIYNPLVDLQKISASSGEAFWQRVAGVLQAKLDPAVRWTPAQLEALDENLQEIYHELRKTFFIQGGELTRVGDSEPDPTGAALLAMKLISAGSGIPLRLLFGSETGERSSTEDQKTFLGMIADRQTTHAEPVILRRFIDRQIEFGVLPRPTTGDYDVVWPPLFSEPEKDISEANLNRARTAKELAGIMGDPMVLVEIDEERNVWLLPRAEGEPSPFEGLEPPPLPLPGVGGGDEPEEEEVDA